tara:strand:- start:250 stop:645 length:396 start_codon:yes stop_codon:yes gene_type:complete
MNKAQSTKILKRSIEWGFKNNEKPNVSDLVIFSAECDYDVQDSQGRTLLMLAALKGSYANSRQLVGSGDNVNLLDKNGLSALDYSKQREDGDSEITLSLRAHCLPEKPETSPSCFSAIRALFGTRVHAEVR